MTTCDSCAPRHEHAFRPADVSCPVGCGESGAGSSYRPKLRPSGHDISRRFADNNGGAIPSNLLQIPNTESNSPYQRHCATVGVKPHPARFPEKLPTFFIEFLTDPGDTVLDIFAGSNTTGSAAENLDQPLAGL